MTRRLIVARDGAELAAHAADWMEHRIREAVDARGRCAVALSGGTTPRGAYQRLGMPDRSLPWSVIDWFLVDERAVRADHGDSNYRMIVESLFAARPEWRGRLVRMPADAPAGTEAARDYSALLPDPLDLIVLGMGEDGHTASLFPGSPWIDQGTERVVCVTGPKPPHRRMTITPGVITSAREVLVLVAGPAKAETLARVLEGPLDASSLPAQLARGRSWMVDAPAARSLNRGAEP